MWLDWQKKKKIPVIGLAGAREGPYSNMYKAGFSGIFTIQNGPLDIEYSKKMQLIYYVTLREEFLIFILKKSIEFFLTFNFLTPQHHPQFQEFRV